LELHKRLEQIRQKYRSADGPLDFLSLKEEIELFLSDVGSERTKAYEKLGEEAESMLIDVTLKIEESRCKPFRRS